jgi:putative glutamine amidotransferase
MTRRPSRKHARKNSRPAIGLTLDAEASGGYSKLPWYALRQNYAESVARAGAVPILLPHELGRIDDYLDRLDGLIVTGGAFDVDPALFGAKSRHPSVTTKDARTAFELAILKRALKRDLPVLGICGGQQLLNVALGGTLIQHIPDEVENALAHEQPNPRTEPGHIVRVEPNTLLRKITKRATLAVNSAHHQAAKKVGKGVVVNARAEDGVIEGIEHPDYRFCLGVQWHPEYRIDPGDGRIFAAFVAAAA